MEKRFKALLQDVLDEETAMDCTTVSSSSGGRKRRAASDEENERVTKQVRLEKST